MRAVFMGTPAFALPTLQALIDAPEHEVAAVYTRADSKSGRGNALRPSPVKELALSAGIPVETPRTLRDAEAIETLAAYAPDVIIVAAYGLILPQEVLDIPAHGCLNVHGSLLPRWRGAAPVQRAILAGDEYAGVCVMQMEAGLDTGAYHTCGRVEVGTMGEEELSERIAQLGAEGMLQALGEIEAGTYAWTAQDESTVTYAEKIAKVETLLSPELTAAQALRRIQASSSSAPARAQVCGREVTVLKAQLAEDALAAGEVALSKKRIALGCANGAIELAEVKPQGKRAMEARAWVAGLQGAPATWSAVQQ